MKTGWIILIVLGAIIILFGIPFLFLLSAWNNANKDVEEHFAKMNLEEDCMFTFINIEEFENISPGVYEITIKRTKMKQEKIRDIGGVKLELNNKEGLSNEGQTYFKNVPGNIEELGTKKVVINDIKFEPKRAIASAYFIDEKNKEFLCNSSGALGLGIKF